MYPKYLLYIRPRVELLKVVVWKGDSDKEKCEQCNHPPQQQEDALFFPYEFNENLPSVMPSSGHHFLWV